MNTEKPAKRRMSRATWIGLGMSVALVVALAWLLGWGSDPAPPVPQLGGAPLSDLYPEWSSPGGGAGPRRMRVLSITSTQPIRAEHLPWLLWRARQQGSPLHRLVLNLRPSLPAWIRSKLPDAVDPDDTFGQIGNDLFMGIARSTVAYDDVLGEMLRLPKGSQRRLTGLVRRLDRGPIPGRQTVDLLLRLVREADPEMRVVAGVHLLDRYLGRFEAVGFEVQAELLRLAKSRAGAPMDWIRLTRFAVATPVSRFEFDPILEELGLHPDSEVAMLARAALCLRVRPKELPALIRAVVAESDFDRQRVLMNWLAQAHLLLLRRMPADVAPALGAMLVQEGVEPPASQEAAAAGEPRKGGLRVEDESLRSRSRLAATAYLLSGLGTNAAPAAGEMLEALHRIGSSDQDASLLLAHSLVGLTKQISFKADGRILWLLQDPFLKEPMLLLIASGGRTNAHAYAAVRPSFGSEAQGVRRAAMEAAIAIHEPDEKLWPWVRFALDDPVRQDVALRVVPRFGELAREALPRLREIASDPSEARGMAEMRRLAKEAIRALEVGGAGP